MRIPLPPVRNKTAPDILVAVNPVWEESWQVARLPDDRLQPAAPIDRVADGGGSALNTACALAMAGWKVSAVGSVGEDREGEACVQALLRRGVAPRMRVQAGRRTVVVRLFVEDPGTDRAFEAVIPPDAVAPWTEEPPGLEQARILLMDRLGPPAVAWLGRRRAAGAGPSVLVVNAPPRTRRSTGWFEAALRSLDVVQIPESEERAPARAPLPRTGLHRPPTFAPLSAQEVAAILAAGVSWLVRTRGGKGAALHARNAVPVELPARASTVVDPTGAGDALAAGMLDAVLRGLGPAEALERGLDWAARACRHLGARGWLDHEPPGSP